MPKKTHLFLSVVSVFSIILSAVFTAGDSTVSAAESIPVVFLSDSQISIQIGEEYHLYAVTSNGAMPTFKSSNSRVASVNTYGLVTAKKAGAAKITAKIKKAETSCKVTVKKTTITLSQKTASIEHGEILTLSATTSNQSPVTWKTSKKSVVSIDENGAITGEKPGSAVITASADGAKATCRVTVRNPKVTLNKSRISLKEGETFLLTAEVSSHLPPVFRSNKRSVALVDENGWITAIKKGSAIITAKVDGISRICNVTVTSANNGK